MGINQGPISLDQKYTQGTGHVFLPGLRALVRLPMAQIRRDRAMGLNTAGFISGYRGSPLGGYDQQLFAARKHLEQYNIKFQPGVNEDLAATAIWGSQQLNLTHGAKYDGVVGIWYGKSPVVARYGIMASGKSYEDIRQALRELGITEEVAAKIGLRLYKIGMPWPLEPEGVRNFAVGLEEIFIVEERREIVENQVKQELFNWRDDVRPRIVGKMDDHDKRFLTFAAELSVASLASSLTERLLRLNLNPEIAEMLRARADWFNGREASQMQAVAPVTRTPYFCSGCPHNTSTKVPEGSRAFAGIGCHFMALWMDRNTETYTHMGGEGVPWVGVAPFTKEQHVFANLGDGTYFHSGSLAIRQAVASGANITYKLPYNDATP